ncbi:hypothetical protein [Pseudomonas brassicacearum]|uniref:hypothetical protein n=1 Tax=Pseudomonas brassicacearum TaxID=930166 RepID=UPI001BDE29E5|nr:hypothetical protein [Pseudomonas brassicacearum]
MAASARRTVTESEMIHVSKSPFSIENRTLSLRRLLKRFFCCREASASSSILLKDQRTPSVQILKDSAVFQGFCRSELARDNDCTFNIEAG